MAYLNVDLDYFDHRKTHRLIALLGKGAELFPIKLWAHAGKFHCEKGILADYSAKEIAEACGCSGDAQALLQALLKCGFLERTKKGKIAVHGWREHQGHIQAFKIRGRLAARVRWAKIKGLQSMLDNATSNTKPNTSNAPTVPTVPSTKTRARASDAGGPRTRFSQKGPPGSESPPLPSAPVLSPEQIRALHATVDKAPGPAQKGGR